MQQVNPRVENENDCKLHEEPLDERNVMPQESINADRMKILLQESVSEEKKKIKKYEPWNNNETEPLNRNRIPVSRNKNKKIRKPTFNR